MKNDAEQLTNSCEEEAECRRSQAAHPAKGPPWDEKSWGMQQT